MNMLITSYVQAQGHRDAHANRAGLDPARWALGWHRAMSALWHLQQLATGTNTGHDLAVANRQLHTAIQLLE